MTTRQRLQSFAPADRSRFVFPRQWGGAVRPHEVSPAGTVCEAEVPSRLHASVLDMNRFDVGVPGGGGIGFGLGLYCRARVLLGRGSGTDTRGNRKEIALHLAELYRAMVGYRDGIELELEDHGTRHLGLGSSIGTLTAAAAALNEVFGRPLSLRDLRKLVAYNYCEELATEQGRLVPGFETNVGAMVALHGGMVVATDRCELLCRISLPEEMQALVVLPVVEPRPTSGEKEAAALLSRARELDRAEAREKTYTVVMDLLPAMMGGDLPGIGESLFRLAHLGSKRAECSLHGRGGSEIYAAMERLRAEGAEIVSMSSVGPAVFALSARPEVWSRWNDWETGGASSVVRIPVDNGGARVRLDGVPIPYRREPWWSEPQYGSGEQHG